MLARNLQAVRRDPAQCGRMPPTGRTTMSDLGYDDAGAGDSPLLFLHDWCGDRTFFASQFEHFAASDRVVSVDLPGHGESPVPAKYEVWSFAAEVADLARELDLGRSVVVG